jgi:very-short-patch-repair endonuclease
MLAEYLEYARAGGVPVAPVPVSSGGYAHGSGRPTDAGAAGYATDGQGDAGEFHADVAARLAELGITVVPQYGVGGYRVDFAAAHPDDPSRMILAIEADGAGYRDSGSVRDRDRLRKEHLERLGWRVHRLWSTAWFTDPGGELAKLRSAFDSAVGAAPPPPPADAAPPPPPADAAQAGAPETPADEPDTWTAPASQRSPDSHPRASSQAEAEPRSAEEPWPRAARPARVGRGIPLGPGERPRLTAPAAKALPSPGRTGPAAPPPGSAAEPADQ